MNNDKNNINNKESKTSCDEQSQLDLKKEKFKNYDFTSVIITVSAIVIALIIVFAIFPACNINLLHNVYNSVSAKEILYVDENNSSSESQDEALETEAATTVSDTAIQPTKEKIEVNKTNTQVVYDEVISTSGKTATINVSNPGSNKYLESIKIYSAEDNTDIYYQSDMMKPGTGLVKITLSKAIGKKAVPVIIEFTFYDSDLTVLDTKMVGATLTPEDKVLEIEEESK